MPQNCLTAYINEIQGKSINPPIYRSTPPLSAFYPLVTEIFGTFFQSILGNSIPPLKGGPCYGLMGEKVAVDKNDHL